MKLKILVRQEVPSFLSHLMVNHNVIAPREKEKGYYAFGVVGKPEEVVLDYVTTILPPKKVLMPQREPLLSFSMGAKPEVTPVIEGDPTVLLGVHPCDIAGIRMLDWAFTKDGKTDVTYMRKREQVTIIGVDCHPDEHCFCTSVGTEVPKEGFDLFLRPIDAGYLVIVGTDKGEEILNAGAQTRDPDAADLASSDRWLQEKQAKIQRSFDAPMHDLPLVFEAAAESEVWDRQGDKCLSCGQCNLVCPTCFCFDVEDRLEIDLASGTRERRWDGCQLTGFAKIASGENFRDEPMSRVRHRFYRKYAYLMASELYGDPFCTGCGRCGRSCLVDINIVDTINNLMAESRKEVPSG